MTVEELKASGAIILECISGSRAYGLNVANSDTDIRGIFILPKNEFYSLNPIDQVSNESNDIVFYELNKFISLLGKNNPNILELINMPDDCIVFRHPIMDMFKAKDILCKVAEKTFVAYAYAQIQKAYGLHKKIFNPMDEQRKSLLDFCYVYTGKQSKVLCVFLKENNWHQEHCGLSALTHFRDCYNLYYDSSENYSGIIHSLEANEVALSSVPQHAQVEALLFCNKDAYSTYCKDYREYWAWVKNRNEARYENTLSHGKNYDAKNIMHTYRLLYMAQDIAKHHNIIVRRPEREFLLEIRSGKYDYDYLLEGAEALKDSLQQAFAQSDLPEKIDLKQLNQLAVEIRERWYEQKL